MKKTLILALFVFGMVLGNGVFILPAKAEGDCVYFSDQYGCNYAHCGDCLAYQCPGGSLILDCA